MTSRTTGVTRPVTLAAFVGAVTAALLAEPVGLPAQAVHRANPRQGALSGVVARLDGSGQPISRAIVRLRAEGRDVADAVLSDDAGRFTFNGLSAGRYRLFARKAGFVESEFGSRAPGRAGTALVLGDGEQIADLVLRMPRSSVISGAVRDAAGVPLTGRRVLAVRSSADSVPLAQDELWAHAVTTDDRGTYRIPGLIPGRYIVAADVDASRPVVTEASVDAVLRALAQRQAATAVVATPRTTAAPIMPPRHQAGHSAIPVFAPGVIDPLDARVVSLGAGEEHADADILVPLLPLAAVEGTIASPTGQIGGVHLGLRASSDLVDSMSSAQQLPNQVTSDADGRFRFESIPPGRYTVWAGSSSAGWASAQIRMTGVDVGGLKLTLRPGVRVAGRVILAPDSSATDVPFERIRVGLVRSRTSGGLPVANSAVRSVSATVRNDGTFELVDVPPGAYRLLPVVPDDLGLSLRSAVLGGVDVLDFGLDLNEASTGLEMALTLSSVQSLLTGRLLSPRGVPATEYDLVAFPSDRTYWHPESRRMAFTRPDDDGRFVFHDLPAGDYYLAALADFDPNEWPQLELLEVLVPAAIPFTLAPGERRVQDVRIAGGSGRRPAIHRR